MAEYKLGIFSRTRFTRLFISLFVGLGFLSFEAVASEVPVAKDTVFHPTASLAFLKMPATTLELLARPMREDMLAYLEHDSIYQVPNALEGLSYFNPPVTDDFLQVQVTPVTKFTIRMLPGKKTPVVATAYTVGDSTQARDTQLQFFTPDMKEIKLEKVIKIASTKDFLDTKGLSRDDRDRLLFMIPFPTVEYIFSPDGTDLKARLTAGEFLSKEVNEKIKPYLRRERVYRWDGSHYKLVDD
ncbi:MAG: DUF3256 family protein [Muribaculaceae bacterium]|nr:DUF3256 family protein [Muribaculaceae bacterium]